MFWVAFAHGRKVHFYLVMADGRVVPLKTVDRPDPFGFYTDEGRWVERVIEIDDVRQDIAMLRTPDGHGRIELARFHTPQAISPEPKDAPANTLGIRRIMFAVDDIEDVVA